MTSHGNSNSPPALDLSPSLFKSSCVGWETWQGKVYEPPSSVSVKSKLLAKLGVSKLGNAVAQVQEQFKDKEWKDRDGKENSLTVDKAADLVFVQAKEASKGQARVGLGPKEKKKLANSRVDTSCSLPRKVPTIKKFAVRLLFSESHTVFSILLFCDCSLNCLICITCF